MMKRSIYVIGAILIILGSVFAIGPRYAEIPNDYKYNNDTYNNYTCEGEECSYQIHNRTHLRIHNESCNGTCNGTNCQENCINGTCNHNMTQLRIRENYDNRYNHTYRYQYNGTLCNGTNCYELKHEYEYYHKHELNHGKEINHSKSHEKEIEHFKGHNHAMRGKMMAKKARGIMNVAKETENKFRKALYKYYQIRQECHNNSYCTHQYFNVTKELLLTAINTTIERLEALNDTNETQEYISKLEEYYNIVANSENISEIREIYPEIKNLIREANREFAIKGYETLIETYKEYALSLQDKYPEEVNKILEELDNLEENLDKLTPKEVVDKLREIRGELMALL